MTYFFVAKNLDEKYRKKVKIVKNILHCPTNKELLVRLIESEMKRIEKRYRPI